MKIGELFVELGIQGSEKAIGMAKAFKDNLTDVSTKGLAAKAAVLGLVYGVERLVLGSAQMGANFKQFGDFTGLSTSKLQQWQYAMMQSNVAAEDTQASIQAVQGSMGKMLGGFGAPMGFGRVNAAVGLDWNRLKDTYYVMDKLREYLKGEKNITVANMVGESFGLTPQVIQGIRNAKGDIYKMPVGLGKGNIDQLARINAAWLNLNRTFEIFKANMTAEYGFPVIKSLQGALKVVIELVSNIGKLITAFPILKDVAIAVAGVLALMFAPVTSVIAGVIVLLNEVQRSREKHQGFWKTLKEDASPVLDRLKKDLKGVLGEPPQGERTWHPPMLLPEGGSNQGAGDKHASINQTIINNGVQDNEIAQNVKYANNSALRQITTLLQVA